MKNKLFFCFLLSPNIFAMQIEEDYVKISIDGYSDNEYDSDEISEKSNDQNELINSSGFINILTKRLNYESYNFLENLKKDLRLAEISQDKGNQLLGSVSEHVDNLVQLKLKEFLQEVDRLRLTTEQFNSLLETNVEKFNKMLKNFKATLDQRIIALKNKNQRKPIINQQRANSEDYCDLICKCLKSIF